MVLPIVVHGLAATAAIAVALTRRWAWLWLAVVLISAIRDVQKFRRELGRSHTLTFCGSLIALDGVAVRAERGWLGPAWTVLWLTSNGRRQFVSVFRSELTGADHAALRRHLRGLDFR